MPTKAALTIPRQLRARIPYFKSSRRNLTTPPNPSPATAPKDAKIQSRLRRFNDRLPSFLRAYTTPLLGAPATHITSFLILHEITAVVPLFGLVAAFHYGNWLPDFSTYSGFEEGTRRFTRWLRKKGWVGEDVEVEDVAGGLATTEGAVEEGTGEKKGVRLVLEFATAYAVTKALLPVRIMGSVWATPWFARVVIAPVGSGVRRLFRR
ncbi:hypothetical protein BJX68DRAFT_128432 [Aspergillus pseudodeflectus]|uniref:DUF1279 domain-containing protein n=1 Tax=Aspergillus pseudodeflectus TaxID=176178 RepID=A0ABR4K0W9_9EURO